MIGFRWLLHPVSLRRGGACSKQSDRRTPSRTSHHGSRDGLDHADFVHAFAPKPYLILSAIRDFFSITGARETYQEAQRAYDLLGSAAKISMTEADDGHGYTKPRRLAAYRWFDKWLKGSEQTWPEPEVIPASEESLRATTTGQVATSLGGETVFTLNQKRAKL